MPHSDPDQAIVGSNDRPAAFVTRRSGPICPFEPIRVK
jgi:hypothetical protein